MPRMIITTLVSVPLPRRVAGGRGVVWVEHQGVPSGDEFRRVRARVGGCARERGGD